ncbi:MAG: hypothetical protein V2A74_07065 [bacterium]
MNPRSTLPRRQQPLLDDEDFLLECHEKGCFAFLDLLNMNVIRAPNDTAFYQQWMQVHSTFMTYAKVGLSSAFLRNQLKHSASADLIAKEFEKKADRTELFVNTIAVAVICGIDNYAEARGFFAIPAYAATTVPLVTRIVVTAVHRSGYASLMLKLISENNDESLLGEAGDEYQSLQELEKSLDCLDTVSEEMLDLMNSDVLKEVNEITGEIRQLIKSTKSIDEINARLAEISACIDGFGESSGGTAEIASGTPPEGSADKNQNKSMEGTK